MSAEHQHGHTEGHESATQELEAARHEKLAELHKSKVETAPDDAGERAKEARDFINKKPEVQTPEPPPSEETETARPTIPFVTPVLNYVQTMASVQRRLDPISRGFSKVIHAPIIEKTSEVIEETIARPSISVGATWTALIVGSIFYFTARRYGYVLSGSEITLSFVVGAIVGLGIEALWRTFRRH